MLQDDQNTFFFRDNSWEPVVEVNDRNLIYCMPVACGHYDKQFRFEISSEEFEVLKSDEERRYFLYAVLHNRYQPIPISSALQPHHDFEQILFGTREKVESLLSSEDAKSNGAVSNLIRLYMERDQEPMMAGDWFQDRCPI